LKSAIVVNAQTETALLSMREADILALLEADPTFEEVSPDRVNYAFRRDGTAQLSARWFLFKIKKPATWRLEDGDLCVLLDEDKASDGELCGKLVRLDQDQYRFDEADGEQTVLRRVF